MPLFLTAAWAALKPLLTNPKVWAGLGLAAVLAALGVQTWRIGHCKADLAKAQAALIDPATRQAWQAEALADARSLADDRASLADLQAAIGRQNAAVTALQAAGAADTAKAQQVLSADQKNALAAQAQAAAIMATKPGPEGCAAARALILQDVGAKS